MKCNVGIGLFSCNILIVNLNFMVYRVYFGTQFLDYLAVDLDSPCSNQLFAFPTACNAGICEEFL